MSTGIIILNYNNFSDTKNCIDSVLKYNTADIKFIVVDNASNEQCQNQIKNYLHGHFRSLQIFREKETINKPLSACSYIPCKKNKGYAQGNNEGIYLAFQDNEIDYLMILNNDILFIEDIIPKLCNYVDRVKNAGIVSPLLLKKDGKLIDYNCARKNISIEQCFIEYLSFFGDIFGILTKLLNKKKILLSNPELIDKEQIKIELPSGSCMLAKKSVFYKIGGFDPNTFLYYEENILYEKTAQIGLENYLIPTISCIHLGASTTKSQPSPQMVRYATDSILYYLVTYKKIPAIRMTFFKLLCKISIIKTDIFYNIKKSLKSKKK